MGFKKFLPWLVAAIAVVGLVIQYKSYQQNQHDCDCEKTSRVKEVV
ncbi:MAG: hypothetical protein AAFP08_08690 [Bacteroidota bacterium]